MPRWSERVSGRTATWSEAGIASPVVGGKRLRFVEIGEHLKFNFAQRAIARLLQDTRLEESARYLKARTWQLLHSGRSQSNEGEILARLARQTGAPATFVEFGFHWREFNCIGLIREFSGLLIDGNERNVSLARRLFPESIRVEACFLTLDNIGLIEQHFVGRPLGILSIDVDGNDYWFLQRLLPLRPAIVVVEYNASFLLERITVPYKPDFDRHKEHPSGLYCGASLTAVTEACRRHGYGLVAVSESGANAFFVRGDLLGPDLRPLAPEAAYRECALTNMWNGSSALEQWKIIRHLEFVAI